MVIVVWLDLRLASDTDGLGVVTPAVRSGVFRAGVAGLEHATGTLESAWRWVKPAANVCGDSN
jgi:hypothetical protein